MSPLLFVMVMEAFSKMMSIVVSGGLFSSIFVGTRNDGEINISHLLFANDTLILCWVYQDHLYHLRCMFLCFEAASDLKINWAKL